MNVGSGETALRTRSARRTASVPRIVGRASSSGGVHHGRPRSRWRRPTCLARPESRKGTRLRSANPRPSGFHVSSVATSGSTPYGCLPKRSAGSGPRPRTWSIQCVADGVQGRVVEPLLAVVAPRRAERLDRVAPGGAPQRRVERAGPGPARRPSPFGRVASRSGLIPSAAAVTAAFAPGPSASAPSRSGGPGGVRRLHDVAGGVGVVRGGALRHELRAVGEAVRADESLEPSGRLAGLGRGPDAVDGQLADRLVGDAAARR